MTREVYVVVDGAVQPVAIFTTRKAAEEYEADDAPRLGILAEPLCETADEARAYWRRIEEGSTPVHSRREHVRAGT